MNCVNPWNSMAAIAIVEVDIRGKLRDIAEMMKEEKSQDKEMSAEEKLKEIKKIIKG